MSKGTEEARSGATVSVLALVALRHLLHAGRIFPVLIISMATVLAGVGLSAARRRPVARADL